MNKRFIRPVAVFAAIATILVAVIASSLSTAAIESQGIGAVPANPNPSNPRSKSIFVYTAKGGTTINDAVKVINNTTQAKTIDVYPVDSQIASDGAFACAQAVDKKTGVGSWISLNKPQVTVPSFQSVTVPFTITLPNNADAGEHNGCIVIQDANPNAKQRQGGVILSFRSAIRVAITVPGDLTAKLTLNAVVQKSIKNNKIVVTPTYANDGNVSLDTTSNVNLKTVFGNSVSSAGGQFPILPKTTAKFNFELKRPFWGGFYKRDVSTKYIKLSDQGKNVQPSSLPTDSHWVFIAPQPPALVLEIAVLIFIIAVVAVYMRKRNERKVLTQKLTDYKVKKGDDIQSLAKKSGIAWKTLAKINKLKPPYTIKPGETVKLPKDKTKTKSTSPPKSKTTKPKTSKPKSKAK